jgi:DNA-binding MarR family transcriptional regulator
MASNRHELTTAIFEDGSCVVLRADSTKPRFMEVIATFYDAGQARDYVRSHKTPLAEHRPERRPVTKRAVEAKPVQASAARPQRASRAKPVQLPVSKPKHAPAVQPRRAPAVHSKNVSADVSERQAAVLRALRSMMDKKYRVEVRGGELAKAASVPQGTLHSVLASLEKKRMIRTERPGTAQFRAIYEVLETARNSARAINGAADHKGASAPARTR